MGNLKSASAGAANGEYTISDLTPADKAQGWSVDAPKGAVPPGDRKPVVFMFSPPKQQPPSSLVHLGMPEWKELHVKVTLKGGAPPPKGPNGPAKTVTVTVRCFMELPLPTPPSSELGAANEAVKETQKKGGKGKKGK